MELSSKAVKQILFGVLSEIENAMQEGGGEWIISSGDGDEFVIDNVELIGKDTLAVNWVDIIEGEDGEEETYRRVKIKFTATQVG